MKRFHTTDQGEVKVCRVTTGSCRYEPAAVHIEFADEKEALFFGEQVLEALYGRGRIVEQPIPREVIAKAKIKALSALSDKTAREGGSAFKAVRKASARYEADQTKSNQQAVERARVELSRLRERSSELSSISYQHLFGYFSEAVPSVGGHEAGAKDELGFRGPKPKLQKGEMLVYRVEQPSGRGAYNIDGISEELQYAEDSTSGGRLPPYTDGLEDAERTELYGFDSFDQLNAYFSQDALRTVSEFSTDEHPIQISEYIVAKNRVRVGGTQLVFDLFSARGTRAMPIQDHRGEPDSVRQSLQDSLRKRGGSPHSK